jgi:hypothetical protein
MRQGGGQEYFGAIGRHRNAFVQALGTLEATAS